MRILITGASSGIGKYLTTALAQAGHKVWGVARSKEKLDEIKQQYLEVETCDWDVTN